ncbi:hypothetical protein KCP77_13815 [Salmonella enterica subsp. enterica]|nr:hypothetical protein KCP77_13815 [Salmonella enterica subsp. enterica]
MLPEIKIAPGCLSRWGAFIWREDYAKSGRKPATCDRSDKELVSENAGDAAKPSYQQQLGKKCRVGGVLAVAAEENTGAGAELRFADILEAREGSDAALKSISHVSYSDILPCGCSIS